MRVSDVENPESGPIEWKRIDVIHIRLRDHGKAGGDTSEEDQRAAGDGDLTKIGHASLQPKV